MKKVLIIGGTYFAGRVFAMIASQAGYSLTFINRGSYSMTFLGEVTEYNATGTTSEVLPPFPAASTMPSSISAPTSPATARACFAP